MEPILIVAVIFASIVLVFYLYFTARNKERLALIEKGADANIFKMTGSVSKSLKFGMFLIGLGVGILFGNIIAVSTPLEEEVAYFSMIFLFGGGSLIAYYLIEKKKVEKGE